MDTIFYICEMLSEPDVLYFIIENVPGDSMKFFSIKQKVGELREFMKSSKFRLLPEDKKEALIESVRVTAHTLGNFMSEIVRCVFSSSGCHDNLVKDWEKTRDLIIGMVEATNYSECTECQHTVAYSKSNFLSAYHRRKSTSSHSCSECNYIQEVKNIIQILSEPALIEFLSENFCGDANDLDSIKQNVEKIPEFMKTTTFRELHGKKKQALYEKVQETADGVRDLITKIVKRASRRQSSSPGAHDLVKDYWKETRSLIVDMLKAKNNCFDNIQPNSKKFKFTRLLCDLVLPMDRCLVKNTEKFLLEKADSSTYNRFDSLKSEALLSMKAFPEWNMNFDDLHNKLDDLPKVIGEACEGQPLALLLIGGLLSLKPTGGFKSLNPTAYDIWTRVKDDLVKIKESSKNDLGNHMWHIFTYCYHDVSYFLQRCFLYFACYLIGYEIPATSLTEIWIAEGFVIPEEGETIEETANKYLEELAQRSLIFVSKRTFIGTIKSCRLPRPTHEFAIKQSYTEGFLVANPDQKEIESQFRLAIHQGNKNEYTEVNNNHIHSFLAFNYDRNVLGSAMLLRVLALRNSAVSITSLRNMIKLRYLGLRGSNISELPQNIGDMENLQTLDVRDTSIEIIPESLWNIKKLRHVYVRSSPSNKGPPSAANISNLQILKTVVVPKSWVKNIPHFLIHLRKLALSNWENIDWKSVSNLLSHMDKLISIAIMGKSIIPSEYVDIRAFPNLETVRSIKLEGIWSCRNLFIDNVKFPPNLTKLTLVKSSLKEDPMPTLERLEALKFLCLQDGAYTGTQMVCSNGGFPKLEFFKLKKLENLENWEVKEGAMSQLTTLHIVKLENLKNWEVKEGTMLQLTTLRVVQCGKLNCPSNRHVTRMWPRRETEDT